MRLLAFVLIGLFVAIQYPLWLGQGGWLKVWNLDRQLDLQQVRVAEMRQRNEVLAAELRDLRDGKDAIEERARHDLGLIKPDEMFFKLDSTLPATQRPAANGLMVERAQLSR